MSNEFDLSEKFPNLKPIKSPPSLSTINGIGTTIYGSRDYDAETGTHVVTQFFVVLFVPILGLAAYRVADAASGWYFIGREPLSGLVKGWNYSLGLAVLLLAGGLYWNHHTSQPDYIAGQQIAEADSLAASGAIDKAAAIYGQVARGTTGRASEARNRLDALLTSEQQDLIKLAGVYTVAVDLQQDRNLFPELYDKGYGIAQKNAEANPAGALALVNAVAPLGKDPQPMLALQRQLLEVLVKEDPQDLSRVGQLASIYEQQGEVDKCKPLLLPHKDRLGQTEGARILGQILANEGQFEEAHGLLAAYTDAHLKTLHQAETAYVNAVKQANEAVVNQLRTNSAPGFDYARYGRLGKREQDAMVGEYLEQRTRDNPSILAAQKNLRDHSRVVGVALDFGIVLLRRAQSMNDADKRRLELERAEKTFLAVRGLAGETDEYRLFLGQVYYWLGKHAEGHELFDKLLEKNMRSAEMLVAVSRALRSVGERVEARKMVEEAYKRAPGPSTKQDIASLRAALRTDLDDEIVWLERANTSELAVKAQLESARGRKALREGKNDEALKHFRASIATFDKMAVDATTLNNSALVWFELYSATGDQKDLDAGIQKMEKALTLEPSNSILLLNASSTVLSAVAANLIGNEIDLAALRRQGSLNYLAYLYRDKARRDQWRDKIRTHPGIAKVQSYLDRLLVLSPKNSEVYRMLLDIYDWDPDLNRLRELKQRLREAKLGLSEAKKDTRDFYEGREDEKSIQRIKAALPELRKQVEKSRATPGGNTYAVAVGALIGQQLTLDMLDEQVDLDEMIQLAESAHGLAPSSATEWTLLQALLTRASKDLAGKFPEYAVMVKRGQRSLARSYLVALALAQPGKLREAALANADVRNALNLMLERTKRFPNSSSPLVWALLRAGHSGTAAEIAQAIRRDETEQLDRELNRTLAPLSPGDVLEEYWARQAANDEAGARKLLKDATAAGVVLPFDLK